MSPSKTPDRKRVGPYTIIERLGEGGMGVVYRGRSKEHEAAVKVIRESMLEREDIRTRFTREIETLQAIESPFVARILGSDMSKKTAWMATEFVDGRSLKDLVDSEGPLSEEDWCTLAEGLLQGLAAIHEAGVIHQDVKPANIMMSPDGPKIIDFGISREIGSTRVTMTGMFAGSAGWMAPERAELDIETTASDVFSAGLVLAFAALGKHPWDGDTTQSDVAITLSMLSKEPDLDSLSTRQRALIEGMLDMDAERRPSATRALGILNGAITPAEVSPRGAKKSIQRKRWGLEHRKSKVPDFVSSALSGMAFAIAAFGATYLAGLAVATGSGSERALRSLDVTSWLLGDALGYSLSALDFGWILSPDDHVTTTLGFRPLVITIVLISTVVVYSRMLSSRLGQAVWTRIVAHLALFLTPLFSVIGGLKLLRAESFTVSGSEVSVAPWSVFDLAFGLGLLVLAAFVGVFLGKEEPARSAVGWTYSAMRRGLPFFIVVSGGVLTSLLAYSLIAPNFLDSMDIGNGRRPFVNYGLEDYFSLVLFVLAFLPSLATAYMSHVIAGRGGIYLQRDNSLVLEGLQVSDGQSGQAWQVLVPNDFLFAALALLLVILTGMIAGASALNRTGIGPTNVRGMVKVAIVSVVTVVLAVALVSSVAFSVQGRWTPTTLMHSSDNQFYYSLIAALVTGVVLTVAMIVGSRPLFWQFLIQAFPRTVAGFRAFKATKGNPRPRLPRVAGIGVLSLMSVVFVAPVAFASTERFLAGTSTPEDIATEWADHLERRDPIQLVEMFSESSQSRLAWLPSEVIDRARPSPGANRRLNVVNANGSKWRLGELDALAKLSWVGEGGGASWDIPIQGSVKRVWGYLRTIEYRADIEPVTLTLSQEGVGQETSGIPLPEINGKVVSPGAYLAVPGTYRVERDGIGFLAPYSGSASAASLDLNISLPASFQVPEGAVSQMTQAIDEVQDACGGLRSSRCIDYDEISRYLRVASGSVPASYYSSSETGYVRGDVRCAAGENQFIGLFEIAHTADCFQIVTSETTFYNSRQIAEPVYSTRCARYSYSWFWGFYCSRYEQYQSGTNYRTVVGSPISTVRYRSEVPFRVQVTAELDEAGIFSVQGAEVR